MRVVVLDHAAELGGAELALVRTLDALPPEVEVRVVLFSRGPLRRLLEERGHRVEVLDLDPAVATATRTLGRRSGTRMAMRAVPFAVRLARRLHALRPDVVHSTSLKADLIGLPATRLARVPLVWHVHDRIATDYLPLPVVRAVRALARVGPAAVVANSAATAATLPGARHLTVVHPGLAPDQLTAHPGRGHPPGPEIVGLLGRVSPTKGQLEFVRAAALVAAERPGVRFRIVGSPLFGQEGYGSRVRSEITRLGLDEVVEMVGFVTDPRTTLDAFTICVHASPVPEPFGQVVVEAMARGVPVVATDAGGIPEILRDPTKQGAPDLGWLVRAGDVDALAHGILAALTDPRREEVAAAAWASAGCRFTAAGTARALLGVWRLVARLPA